MERVGTVEWRVEIAVASWRETAGEISREIAVVCWRENAVASWRETALASWRETAVASSVADLGFFEAGFKESLQVSCDQAHFWPKTSLFGKLLTWRHCCTTL